MAADMPAQARRAVMLLWISLVVSLVVSLLQVDWPPLSDAGFPWWLVAIIAITYLVLAALVFLVSRGHNWARMLVLGTTVIGAIVMFIPWPGIEYEWTVSDLATQIGLLVLDGVALFWLFTGAGAAWFATRKGEGI